MRPNIVWVTCDQLRWDAVGYASNSIVRTPNIDRLADEGVVFDNAYCASPVCSPSRASMFSGLYPHAHQQYKNYSPGRRNQFGSHMLDEIETIGDVLKNEGYACGYAGVWHLGNDESPQHGFTDFWKTYRYLGPETPDPFFEYIKELGISNPYAKDALGVFTIGKLPCGILTDPRQQRTTWTMDNSLSFLEREFVDPFFLLIGVKDPHPMILPPRDLLEFYPEEQMQIPENFLDMLEGKPEYQEREKFRLTPGSVGDDDIRTLISYYYALVTHIDNQIGRLVSHLERRGMMDDTIVVVNSDHGEMLGNHGFVEKCVMYEESVRVPCLIRWPAGIPKGQRVSAPLGGIDLAPTLLELAGAPVPNAMEGRSFAADIRAGTVPEARPVFAEIGSDAEIDSGSNDPEQLATHVMVVNDGWKYVWNRFYGDELYNLIEDRSEMTNLADKKSYRDRIVEYRRLIVEMLEPSGPGLYDWCLRDTDVHDKSVNAL